MRALLLCLLTILAPATSSWAGDAGVVGADAGTVDAGDADAADASAVVVDPIAQDIAGLEAVLRLEIPERPLNELVGVDVADEAAVAAAKERLRADLQRVAGVDAGVAAANRQRLASLRLTILELPEATRLEVINRQEERRRQSRLAAAAAEAEAERAAAQAAIRAAQEAADAARGRDRAIADGRLRLEKLKSAQVEARTALAAEAAQLAADAASWGDVSAAHRQALSEPSTNFDRLYDDLVAELVELRAALDQATDRALDVRTSERPELPIPSLVGLSVQQQNAVGILETMLKELVLEASAIDAAVVAQARARAEKTALVVNDRNGIRLQVLAKLSPSKHDETLGFGAEGLKQLLRELEHARVVARFLWFVEAPAAQDNARSLSGLTVTRLSLHTLLGLAVVVAGIVTSRRGRRWLALVNGLSARIVGRNIVSKGIAGVVSALDAVWVELVIFVTVFVLGEVAKPVLAYAAGSIIYGFLLAWAVFKLVVSAVHQTIRFLARPQLGALSQELSTKAFESVRFVGRTVLALSIFLNSTEALVGRGYLYTTAVRLGLMLTIPVTLILIRRWQDDIASAYLRLHPRGRLAQAVTETRERWFSFFIVLVAFGFVASQALWSVAGRFVLNFDQTRKALAFVFRRRLERRAREQPEDEKSTLPDVVIKALEVAPAQGKAVLRGRLIELEAVKKRISAWLAKDQVAVGAVVVVGDAGVGKTTWLNALHEELTLPVSRLAFSSRVVRGVDVVGAIARALDIDAASLDALVSAVEAGPKRALLIDDVQHLWLRGAHQREAWQRFGEVLTAIGHQVFVVASCSAWTFKHIRWAVGPSLRFRQTVWLTPWSEAEIHTLLSSRTERCGFRVLYDDLVIAKTDVENRELQLMSTAQEYTRLLWDFADGCPAVALDAWRRSLSLVGDHTLRVRLFAQPPDSVLEALDNVGRFALAAVLWNDVVTADDASLGLRLADADVKDALRRLVETGVINDVDGQHRINVSWWSSAARFLRRKHLIAD